jgi:hypothetical protein
LASRSTVPYLPHATKKFGYWGLLHQL